MTRPHIYVQRSQPKAVTGQSAHLALQCCADDRGAVRKRRRVEREDTLDLPVESGVAHANVAVVEDRAAMTAVPGRLPDATIFPSDRLEGLGRRSPDEPVL